MADAFKSDVMNQLYRNIRRLYERREAISQLELTADEYLNVFVPRDLHEAFRFVAGRVSVRDHDIWKLPTNDYELECGLETLKGFPIPKPLHVLPTAPPETLEKIRQWVDYGGNPSRDFGRVNRLLVWMNTQCSRNAIRYYWPSILALCNVTEDTKYLAREMQELRMPTRLKPLPHGVIRACKQTAETIATASLLPEVVEKKNGDGVALIGIKSGQYYQESFGSFYGLG